jgi:AbrB family looped-hinge helix DNA binding protein
MAIATVTGKGQIAIPASIRKRLGIHKGTRLHVEERGEEIVLKPLNVEHLDRMAGILKGPVSLSRKLLEARAVDRQQEA